MSERDDLDGLRVGGRVYRKIYSSAGHPCYVWEQADVPAIDLNYLDCSVYLYPSVSSAKAGARAGGSGFLVSIRSTYDDGDFHRYVVTNQHVALKAKAVRLNTVEGGTDIVDLENREWVYHPHGDDLAVCSLEPSDAFHRFRAIDASPRTTMLLSRERVKTHNIGPGDEVFLIGRFFNHAGEQRNLPTARFGRIAQMPCEPVRQKDRSFDQETFLVEIH